MTKTQKIIAGIVGAAALAGALYWVIKQFRAKDDRSHDLADDNQRLEEKVRRLEREAAEARKSPPA